MKFQDAFRTLTGRDAKQADILEFERLVTVFDTTPNDSLLAVFVALNYYRSLYVEVPGKIQEASVTTLNNFKVAADALAEAAMAKTQKTLTDAVVKASVEAANNTATAKAQTEVLRWRTIAGVVGAVMAAAVFWFGHSTGEATGYVRGIQETTDQKAATSWAATPQGQVAFRFAKSGVLDGLAKCTLADSWKVEKGFCYPQPNEKNMVQGWPVQ